MDANNLKCLFYNCVHSCVSYYYLGKKCKDNSGTYAKYIFMLESGCEDAIDKFEAIDDTIVLPAIGSTVTCTPGIADLNPIVTCTSSSDIIEIT